MKPADIKFLIKWASLGIHSEEGQADPALEPYYARQRKRLWKIQTEHGTKKKQSLIEHETRTLPSGRTFKRHRCRACRAYWDTELKYKPDEKEYHEPDCPLNKSK